jgi:hypothetical protein
MTFVLRLLTWHSDQHTSASSQYFSNSNWHRHDLSLVISGQNLDVTLGNRCSNGDSLRYLNNRLLLSEAPNEWDSEQGHSSLDDCSLRWGEARRILGLQQQQRKQVFEHHRRSALDVLIGVSMEIFLVQMYSTSDVV